MEININELESLLREFWNQAITKHEINLINGKESLFKADNEEFNKHIQRLKENQLPNKIENLIK